MFSHNERNLLILGLSGSGKSYVSKQFKNQGWDIISAGDVLREICTNLGVGTDRKTLRKYGNEILINDGITYFADLLIKQMHPQNCTVFEGIRSLEVIEIIRIKLDCLVLYIDCNVDNRFERLKIRDQLSIREYKELESIPFEKKILEIKKSADIIIDNNSSPEKLERNINSLNFLNCKKI